MAAALALPLARRQRRGVGPDFRVLVGESAWAELPSPVRSRFAAHAERTYPGVVAVRATPLGWLIAQACRLVGTPVAPWRGQAVPVSVRVWTDDEGALVWDRTYAFPDRRPILITSRKRLEADGQLTEVARGGLGMRLAASVEDGVLHFRSRGYFWRIAGLAVPIPDVATPGAADVIHRDEGAGRFTFCMRFVHPWAGETLFQRGTFEDPCP